MKVPLKTIKTHWQNLSPDYQTSLWKTKHFNKSVILKLYVILKSYTTTVHLSNTEAMPFENSRDHIFRKFSCVELHPYKNILGYRKNTLCNFYQHSTAGDKERP